MDKMACGPCRSKFLCFLLGDHVNGTDDYRRGCKKVTHLEEKRFMESADLGDDRTHLSRGWKTLSD